MSSAALRGGARLGAWVLVVALLVAAWAWRREVAWLATGSALFGFGVAAGTLAAEAAGRALETRLRAVLDAEYGGFDHGSWTAAPRHDPVVARVVLRADASPPVESDGVVSVRAEILELKLRDVWVPAAGGIALAVGGAADAGRIHEWVAGRTIEAPMTFRRPARYANEGVRDFERESALGGVTLLASVKSSLLVEVRSRAGAVAEAAAGARAFTRRAVGKWVRSPRPAPMPAGPNRVGPGEAGREGVDGSDAVAAGIVTAVLIGDRAGIPDAVRTRMQAAGTYHVIAISGSNIALFAALAVAIPVLVGASSRGAAWVSILALVLYGQVVTAGPSVWRATLMACLHLLAVGLDHRAPSSQVVALAAAAMVLLRPFDVLDPGFLLTFGATMALIVVAGRLPWIGPSSDPLDGRSGRRMSHRRVLGSAAGRWAMTAVAATCAIDVVLLPVTAHAFGQVTVAGVLLNLVALPLMAIVQVAGMAVVACEVAGIPASWPGWSASSAAWLLVESARLVDLVPWAARAVSPPSLGVTVVYYAACAAVAWGRGWRRGIAAVVLLCGLAVVWTGYPLGHARRGQDATTLRLTMFDVGQGESVLIEPPADADGLLVDAGGRPFGGDRFDIGRLVLLPALRARGVTRLNTLVITHADPDHVGGARSLVERLPIGTVAHGVSVAGHAPTQALLESAAAAGATVSAWRRLQALQRGSVRLRVLHPPPPDWERRRVRNDDSVVLELLYGDVALLLTGDVGADVERAILPQLTRAGTRVLKVAHHGSRTSTSTALLEGWRPQVALISAGRGNPFGHPAREVLDRLDAAGATVYRTDRDGQITLETDGRALRVRTRLGARLSSSP